MGWRTYFDSLVHLLSPELCYLCWSEVPLPDIHLCSSCCDRLPYTVDFDLVHNHVSKHLYGRVPITHAAALLNYWSGSPLKEVLHQLKYKKRKDIGVWLGHLMADRIRHCPLIHDIDVITYVPLHTQKERKRGYNQSRVICEGIQERLSVPIADKVVHKSIHNDSQTRKSRLQRLENVRTVYTLQNKDPIANKSVLLVDDVVTTGATIEATARELIRGGCSHLYVISAAVARM